MEAFAASTCDGERLGLRRGQGHRLLAAVRI
jgi:hypothetical protein